MNSTLATESLCNPFAEGPAKTQEYQHTETGWEDVALGLSRIVWGYVLLAFSVVFVITIVAAYVMIQIAEKVSKDLKYWSDIGLFIGVIVAIGVWLTAYYMLIRGHWLCLLRTPERHGAKWMIFTCLLCLFAVPVLQKVTFYTGMIQPPKMKKGQKPNDVFANVQVSTSGKCMQLACMSANALGNLSFMLFLYTLARCWRNAFVMNSIIVYIVATVVLVGTVCTISYAEPMLFIRQPLLSLGLFAGGLFLMFSYLLLIYLTRGAIYAGLRTQFSAYR